MTFFRALTYKAILLLEKSMAQTSVRGPYLVSWYKGPPLVTLSKEPLLFSISERLGGRITTVKRYAAASIFVSH